MPGPPAARRAAPEPARRTAGRASAPGGGGRGRRAGAGTDAEARGPRRDGLVRREAILDAALRCFERSGILATGIEDVRREAGASPSSVYHLFGGGLPAIVDALLARTFERLFGHMARRVGGTRTAAAAVSALVLAQIEWALRHPAEGRFMYQAMSVGLGGDAGELARRKAELLQPVLRHLGGFVAAGELPRWPPLQLEIALLGPTHEALRRRLSGAPLPAAWMRRELPRLAWRAVSDDQS